MEDKQLRAGQYAVTVVMKDISHSIPPDLPLHEVLATFSKQGDRPLVVIGPGGMFVGVITPMDIIEAISSSLGLESKRMISGFDRFLKGSAQTAGDLISDERVLVQEHARISDAISVMERTRSSFIIVVNEQNSAIGCVGLSDIIAYIIHPKPRN